MEKPLAGTFAVSFQQKSMGEEFVMKTNRASITYFPRLLGSGESPTGFPTHTHAFP